MRYEDVFFEKTVTFVFKILKTMDKFLFSEKMKLADLISANHNLILMLSHFGIPLGFGDRSVKEVCVINKVPVDFFLLVCNVYTFDSYLPEKNKIKSTDMSMLVPYLLASHSYYMEENLPHIERHLSGIINKVDKKYGDVLQRFFTDYRNEVEEHFRYEEQTVFPYIDTLLSGGKHESYHIRDYAQAHSNIEDKLNDLTQIVFKYLPGNISPKESIELVFDIFQFSTDLNKHTLIEDKILVPYVEILERKNKA